MLSDRELRGILDDMAFNVANENEPFDPDEQIQPCSIDLRVDAVFWIPRRNSAIDLRRSRLLELQPRRYYKKVSLRPGESVVIRPRQMILARVYEEFSVPREYSAEIIGRSSFARMGLMIHCSDGFINPGYRGHMPLQLINFNSSSIRVVPYVPICQLRVFKLTSESEKVYGDTELQSKYLNDDGGPSYWWRDKRIKRLHEKLGETNVEVAIQEQIMQQIGPREPELIERLERHLDHTTPAERSNAHALLESFAKKESRRVLRRKAILAVTRGCFPLFLALVLGSLFSQPLGRLHAAAAAAAVLSLPVSWFGLRMEVGDHLTASELERIQMN